MFGRKRQRDARAAAAGGADDVENEFHDDPGEVTADVVDGATTRLTTGTTVSLPPDRPTGPWDIADLPDDGVARIDLGGLRIPVLEGVEVRINVDESTGQLMSATLATAQSTMQLLAFAAPKSAGIWTEIRAEIVASIQVGGGRVEAVDGPYGIQVVADVPTDVPGQLAAARFFGVDGPRWFLRGLLQGQAASTVSAEPLLLRAFGLVAVVRGEEAMAVRDGLLLHLPKEVTAPGQAGDDGSPTGTEDKPDLSLFERGPEITETR